MAALDVADGNEFCSPPGLGGTWKVRFIRSGLMRRVLVKTPDGIVFARVNAHGVCQNCARSRDTICSHCNCVACVWEREVAERSSPLVPKAKWLALMWRVKNFEMRPQRKVVELDVD